MGERVRSSSRARHRLCAGPVLLLFCAVLGCGAKPIEISPAAYPSAGLYTPGSTLGAGDPTDVPTPGMGLGNRCVSLNGAVDGGAGNAADQRSLQVDYTTQTQNGRYAPKNCTAVWLESADDQYVATLEIGCALRRPGLVYWQDHACTEKPGPDVVTSATLPDHKKPHTVMWSGRDFNGNVAPDGPYKLYIEVTESDKEPGDIGIFDFDKGLTPSSVDAPVAADGPLQQVTIAWSTMKQGGSGGAAGRH